MDYTKRYGTKYRDEFFPDKINDLVDNDGHLNIVPQMRRKSNYLYELKYDNLDYKYAYKYMKDNYLPKGACSVFRKGNWIGRNYDFTYDYRADFVVRTPPGKNNYASIGVASSIPNLTVQNIEAGEYFNSYRVLPFYLVDGLNEHGLFCNINVIPAELGKTTGSKTTEKPVATIPMTMLVRYILDHYKTVDEAIAGIQTNVSVYANNILWNANYEAHFLLADGNKTVVLEFVNNEPVVIESNYMTNFPLAGVEFKEDGSVATPELGDPVEENNIVPHGSGLERWNDIVNNYNNLTSKEAVATMLTETLNYNLSYTRPMELENDFWYSEFVGVNSRGDVRLDSPLGDYVYVIDEAKERFNHRDRAKPEIWHTTHSCIYDLTRKKLYVYDSSEDGIEYSFTFKKYYTAEEIDAIIDELVNK